MKFLFLSFFVFSPFIGLGFFRKFRLTLILSFFKFNIFVKSLYIIWKLAKDVLYHPDWISKTKYLPTFWWIMGLIFHWFRLKLFFQVLLYMENISFRIKFKIFVKISFRIKFKIFVKVLQIVNNNWTSPFIKSWLNFRSKFFKFQYPWQIFMDIYESYQGAFLEHIYITQT